MHPSGGLEDDIKPPGTAALTTPGHACLPATQST
jgi:hypothetical protein